MNRRALPMKQIGLGVGLVLLGTLSLLVGERVVRAQATTPPGTVTAPGRNPAQAAPGRPAPPPPDTWDRRHRWTTCSAGDGDDRIPPARATNSSTAAKATTIEGAPATTLDGGPGNDVIGGPDGSAATTGR